MNLKDIKKVYFIGIGGIGMSALARYFKSLGAEVSGYDLTATALTDALIAEGIAVTFEDNVAALPRELDLVVYTPAIPATHQGLKFYQDNGYQMMKRSEVLGLISADKFAICVAGSHGKTTVSAMIAHILTHSGYGCSAFLGGIASNYNTNYLRSDNDVVVIEADEYDRSFHRLSPDMAVVTSVDTDHLDVYGSREKIEEAFVQFTEQIAEEGILVIRQGEAINDKLPTLDKAFYHLTDTEADVYCSKYWVVDGGYLFNLMYYGKEHIALRLNIGGLHNVENALAAYSIARELKISHENIKAALASFKGIKRRFELVCETASTVYIDDYAHHPEEIRAFIESVKEMHPRRKVTAIFQPHLFSRTKDLAVEFARELSKADEVILLDIYPAREQPMEGVTSKLILDLLTCTDKQIVPHDQVLTILQNKPLDVITTIGAGNIDKLVAPIKSMIQAKA
jgi:UDP-N-acetylmuramate--alanine ligase